MSQVTAITLGTELEPSASAPPAQAGRSAEALALEAQGGSHRAFERLVERFEEPLYRFFLVRGDNPADAEEATQEAFVQAWQAIERFDARWRFSTWLYTIAKRQAIGRLRRVRPMESREELEASVDEHVADPAHVAEFHDERDNLWAVAREVLSVDERSALWLRYAEDLSTSEIAGVLGRRAVSVRVLLFRARGKLAKRMNRSGEEA